MPPAGDPYRDHGPVTERHSNFRSPPDLESLKSSTFQATAGALLACLVARTFSTCTLVRSVSPDGQE